MWRGRVRECPPMSGISSALGLLGVALFGSQAAPAPPCDPAGPPGMTLVAPATLPIRYDGGFYLEPAGPGYPDGPDLSTENPVTVTVTPATASPLAHGYPAGPERRDENGRWPLRFEAGDGPARIGITYTESLPGLQYCVRELSAVVQPTPVDDARVRLTRPSVRFRRVDVDGIEHFSVTVKIRGRAAPTAAHPVRLDIYYGRRLARMHTTAVRRGRVAATIHLKGNAGQGRVRVSTRAVYPGDVAETWPCDDVFTTGSGDGCRDRLTAPRWVRRTSGH